MVTMSGAPRHGGEKSFKEYAMAQDYEINVKVKGVDQAKSSVDNLTDSMNEAGEASGAAFSKLDSMLGGVPSKIKGAVGGVKNLAGGFKSLRAAIISTGIGALVVALASLATFFTKTQRGAEMLEKAQAGLGAAFAVITDKVSALGEGLINVFTNPIESIKGFADSIKTFVIDKVEQLIDGFGVLGSAVGALFRGEFSEAAELAKEGFMKVGDSVLALNPATAVLYQVGQAAADIAPDILKAANAAVQLSDDSIKLRENQRKLKVTFAETRAEIAKLRLVAEDETLTLEERMAAAERAMALENGLMAEREKAAKEELRIHNERMELAENTEEDYERRAELEAGLIDIQTNSFKQQRRLLTELQSLRNEAQAEEDAAEKERLDAIAANRKKELEIELLALQKKKEMNEKTEAAIAALKTQAVSSTFSILKNLTDASEKDTEKSAKKAFNRNKAISVAETLVNTYMAAQKAYASQIIPLDPSSIIRAQIAAGIAVASGLAKVAAIKSTQFSGGGGGGSASAGGVSGGGGGGSVGVDVGSLVPNTATPTPEPVRAYVVSNEISNQQALDRELQIQTTL
jgi:hypothetical protein